jgi:hypothetical protein
VTTVHKQNDMPLPFAVALLLGVVCAYAHFNYLRFKPMEMRVVTEVFQAHSTFVWVSLSAFTINLTFLSIYLKRTLGLEKQGSKLAHLEGSKRKFQDIRSRMVSFLIGVVSYFAVNQFVLGQALQQLNQIGFAKYVSFIATSLNINMAIFSSLASYVVLRLIGNLRSLVGESHKLEDPEVENGDLVLGTTPGEITRLDKQENEEETWVTIPSRGVNGGIFISGSVGSGKTQGAILRYLAQLLKNKSQIPAMLLIDPKGMYLVDAEQMLKRAGLHDRIVKISLRGKESFNVVYDRSALRESRFISLAEMTRAAAVNFMGKATDSPFWDISSANLVRNAIVACAAKFGYFTLTEVYETIVEAADGNLGRDLKLRLVEEESFNEEERFNIESAIRYFDFEYSKLEDRVRTGIMATSTAFINQFQEFAANRVFCPAEKNLTIRSMEDLIRQGKIILFDIQQPGLARSMGTFIKLHFQQAVLNLLAELKQKPMPYTTAIIIDEYQDVVTCGGGGTLGDDTFMAKARESKPAVIVATQSISSLMDSVGSQRPAMVLLQNFRTRIACHSSDLETIKIFQELAGKEDVETKTHSLSETAQSAKLNLLAGGFDSQNSSINESVSRATRREDLLTGKEFSRLRTFEAFAQVFDGIETKFVRLYLKPDFLKFINTKHETVLEILRATPKDGFTQKIKSFVRNVRAVAASLFLAGNVNAGVIPNVCTVASSPAFNQCLELSVGGCACGFPPHPCALISYYVPQSFIEVWPEQRTSYFSAVPGAAAQLAKVLPTPFGAEGDDDTQSFQARSIAVPLTSFAFRLMPSGGTRMEKMCFDGMSEHFGTHWNTGKGDLLQPTFLAWGAAPKACLLKGAVTSAVGDGSGSYSPDSALCSFPFPKTDILPPSAHPVCNGWGVFFPRYGTYSGPASMTGALMVASRIKSLSSEVLHSMPSSPDEKWQMVYPQSSSCFREGQNIGVLESIKNARETMRLANGKLKGYLFVVWQKTVACKELTAVPQAQAAALAIPAACGGMK